jgi:hypothetical protein
MLKGCLSEPNLQSADGAENCEEIHFFSELDNCLKQAELVNWPSVRYLPLTLDNHQFQPLSVVKTGPSKGFAPISALP